MVELQSRPVRQIKFYRLKKTSLFGADSCKFTSLPFYYVFSENDNNDVKTIIPSDITNCVASTVSDILQNHAALLWLENDQSVIQIVADKFSFDHPINSLTNSYNSRVN